MLVNIIKEPALRELINSKVIFDVCVTGREGGYVVIVQQGLYERTLVTRRGTPRLFSLDNASKYLCSVGFPQFRVDASDFVPGRMRKARPDRAEALKKTKAAPH